eukprot:Pgem_evm1s15419
MLTYVSQLATLKEAEKTTFIINTAHLREWNEQLFQAIHTEYFRLSRYINDAATEFGNQQEDDTNQQETRYFVSFYGDGSQTL